MTESWPFYVAIALIAAYLLGTVAGSNLLALVFVAGGFFFALFGLFVQWVRRVVK